MSKQKLKEGWQPFRSKAEAETLGEAKVLTTRELFLMAIEMKKETSLGNYQQYKIRGNVFLKFLRTKKIDNQPIEKVTKQHIREFLLPYKSHNKNGYIQIIKAIFSTLNSEELTSHNPMTKILKVKATTKKHKTYDLPTMAKIINFAEQYPFLKLLLLMEYYQFARPSEIQLLETDNIDLVNNKITFIQKKGHKEVIRTQPLHPEVKKVIEKMDLSEMYLFKLRKKDGLRAQWERLKRKLDLPEGSTMYAF